MILCASPDPKEIHKTISTLEYGAKAKCIVRGPHTPSKDKFGGEDSSSCAEALAAKVAAMDQFIYRLQMEKKEAHKELMKKDKEMAALREEVQKKKVSEEEINMKVNEKTETLKSELEKKLEECRKLANDFIESERRRMEERMVQQELELEMLRKRLEEIESQVDSSSSSSLSDGGDGSGFTKRLMSVYGDEDPGMVKSMDLDMSDLEPLPRHQTENNNFGVLQGCATIIAGGGPPSNVGDPFGSKLRGGLSTVYEEEEEEEIEDGGKSLNDDEEVEKGIIDEKRVVVEPMIPDSSSRQVRIQNIFTLCGNNRELCRQTGKPILSEKNEETAAAPPCIKEIFLIEEEECKENCGANGNGEQMVSKEENSPVKLTTDDNYYFRDLQSQSRGLLSPLENKLPLSPALVSR